MVAFRGVPLGQGLHHLHAVDADAGVVEVGIAFSPTLFLEILRIGRRPPHSELNRGLALDVCMLCGHDLAQGVALHWSDAEAVVEPPSTAPAQNLVPAVGASGVVHVDVLGMQAFEGAQPVGSRLHPLVLLPRAACPPVVECGRQAR